MKKLFGTDGVRGIANMEPMTTETVMRLGRAAAYLFKKKKGRHRIVIGKDTRVSGYMLESALTAGICSMGVDVLLVGPMPTPAIALITRSLRADAGVMISASHNPFEDNGIKFFSPEGLKLPDDVESQIEKLVESGEIDAIRPTAREIGKAFRIDDARGRYIEYVKNTVPRGMDFQGLKIVVDCAHGAAYRVTPSVFRELGADIIVTGDSPDGMNINKDCGALFPDHLKELVKEHGADLGIAHDGDADRVIFVDRFGAIVDGDQVMAACAMDMKKDGRLKRNTVVATVMSNMGMEAGLKKEGIGLVRTPVGDRYVLEKMIQEGYNFGGEQSGHIIFLDFNTTGDGLITALQMVSLMKKTGKPLHDLVSSITLYPQVLVNVRVAKKVDLSEIPGVKDHIAAVETKLGEKGRILVRFSGTEPLIRIMIEGEDLKMIEDHANHLAETVKNGFKKLEGHFTGARIRQ
ncbi:MAG TPA: phosphoglucosamine mutase [Nitrospiria bacterium]|nr:phosphoglucosamine mutase [Nitrospiria bacterium]